MGRMLVFPGAAARTSRLEFEGATDPAPPGRSRPAPRGQRAQASVGFHFHNSAMTLTELRYIVAVARERHFGRAAEACFVSQPTLSVAIKKLEEELDVKIFERGSNEVSLTALGTAIVRQAQSVIEQAAAIKEIAKRGQDPLSGALKLANNLPPYERLVKPAGRA